MGKSVDGRALADPDDDPGCSCLSLPLPYSGSIQQLLPSRPGGVASADLEALLNTGRLPGRPNPAPNPSQEVTTPPVSTSEMVTAARIGTFMRGW